MCDIVKSKQVYVDLDIKYNEAPETDAISINGKGGSFEFTKKFSYLGSTLTFMIDDSIDVKYMIIKAVKEMGVLRFIWSALEIPI